MLGPKWCMSFLLGFPAFQSPWKVLWGVLLTRHCETLELQGWLSVDICTALAGAGWRKTSILWPFSSHPQEALLLPTFICPKSFFFITSEFLSNYNIIKSLLSVYLLPIPSHIPLSALLQIHGFFFLLIVIACIYLYVYTQEHAGMQAHTHIPTHKLLSLYNADCTYLFWADHLELFDQLVYSFSYYFFHSQHSLVTGGSLCRTEASRSFPYWCCLLILSSFYSCLGIHVGEIL